MYSQLIYLIVALVLFTLQQPGAQPLFSPLTTWGSAALSFFFYAWICYLSLQRLRHSAWSASQSLLSRRYHRIQNRLSILALAFVAFYVYVLNIKFYLRIVPGFDQSLTLSGLAGIGLFLMHMMWVWIWSHPVYRKIYGSSISLKAFVKGQIAFVSAILIPWFLISAVIDLLQLVKLPTFLSGDLEQFILLGALLCIFILFAPWLVVRLWGCKPLPAGSKRAELQSFCREYDFRVGDFMHWPLFGDEMLTAGIIGILPRWRYILITKGLLNLLDIDELRAVVAHEMGHVRRLHIIMYVVFFVCYSLLAYSFHDVIFLFLIRNETILHWAMGSDAFDLTMFSIVYTIPILVMLVLYFRYVFGFFMRNSERQADLYALKLMENPYSLISSLQKIAFYSGRIEDLPSWHHFSIRQRIDCLTRSFQRPSLIRKHDLKLYGSIGVFLVLVAALSFTGFRLQDTKAVKQWQMQAQAQILESQIHRQTADPELYATYAGLLVDLKQYKTALSLLTKALDMAPQNVAVLNNLAWLYAISPAPYYHPQKALNLALKAVALKPEPYVLDTLAEAYYVNGRYQDALRVSKEALTKSAANKDYFVRQMEKFKRAARQAEDGDKTQAR